MTMLGRRQFCSGLGAGALLCGCASERTPAAGSLPDAAPPSKMTLTTHGTGKSRVVEVRWARAVDLQGKVDAAAARVMADAAVTALVGGSSPWSTWAGPKRTIGIKVNTITSQAHTHPAVAAAVARGLVGAGASPQNVTVWDRDGFGLRDRGYTLDPAGKGGFRCLGTDGVTPGAKLTRIKVAGNLVPLSPLLTGADLLINLAALKDHSMAGVTLSLKNNFGMFPSAIMFHGEHRKGSGCEPGISQFAAAPEIKGRTCLPCWTPW